MPFYLKRNDSYDDYNFPIYIVESIERTNGDDYIICHSADCISLDTDTKYRFKFDKLTCKMSNNVEDLADVIYVYNDWTGESKIYSANDAQKAKDLYNKWYAEFRDKGIEELYSIILHYCVRTKRCLQFISQHDSQHDNYL